MIISLDMYQTLFAAVCVLMLGRFLKARIGFLENSAFPRRSSAACCLPFSPVCAMWPALPSLNLTTF